MRSVITVARFVGARPLSLEIDAMRFRVRPSLCDVRPGMTDAAVR